MAHIHELYDFTTSAFIVHPTDDKVCLLLHKKLGKWLQPGGHIELDETIEQALFREVYEETGIQSTDLECIDLGIPRPKHQDGCTNLLLPFDINVHPFTDTQHQHMDISFVFRSKTSDLVQEVDNEGGSLAIAWFTPDEMQIKLSEDTMHVSTYERAMIALQLVMAS